MLIIIFGRADKNSMKLLPVFLYPITIIIKLTR